MELPKDPMMLFSVINMKLRDCYSSLDELCEDMDVDKEELVSQLKAAGFEYSAEHNNSGNGLFFNLQTNNLSEYPKRLHKLCQEHGDVFFILLLFPSISFTC